MRQGSFDIRTVKLARSPVTCQMRRWVLPALLFSHRKVAGTAAPGSSPGLNPRSRKMGFAAGTVLCFPSKEKNFGVVLLQSVVGQLRAGVHIFLIWVYFFLNFWLFVVCFGGSSAKLHNIWSEYFLLCDLILCIQGNHQNKGSTSLRK